MPKRFKEEKTLILVKPDGVKRGLVGEIVKRIEQRGLKIIALKMFWANEKDFTKHYSDAEDNLRNMGQKTLATYQKLVHGWIVEFMTSGPIIKMVIQGLHAVEMVRKLVGNTMPSQAEMGTIRGDFSVDSSVLANAQKRAIRNIVHASGNLAEAEHEISLWFTPDEIHVYTRAEEDIMF
ncbi:MAG: nucleoside-diphosphate kinase [Parcubacteria group bacterium Athens0714_26]|nr:MAG: nucleoside-diphosphate kinase [Parcubacteria group bacterium Athens0714_26]